MKTNLSRHYGRLFGIALISAAPSAMAAPVGVADDFESYTSGTVPLIADWSSTYQADPSDQQGLFTVEDALGADGSKGYSLDVATAEQTYKSIRQIGATGEGVIVEADFQIATDGTLLTTVPSGVNKGIIGIEISDTATWWNGNGYIVSIARRNNGFWGLSMSGAPFTEGYENNTDLGLEPRAGEGLAAPAGTSDWFTLSLVLTDTGLAAPASGWTCVATVTNKSTGAVVFTSGSLDVNSSILTGSTLYGGLTAPFTGFSGAKVNTVGKVSAATADNFSIFGYVSSIDADSDGLTELEEALLGTSDSNSDTDGDGYSDKYENDNGYDPLDANSNPIVVLYADYSAANGYADGNLSGQEDWLGQTNTQVDATAGTISEIGTGYIRTVYGNGALGSTGGNPATATGTFATGDVISIDYDYQFTLPATGNHNLVVAGFRGETADDSAPVQGFKLAYNQFSASTGGNIKFWPDLVDSANADALIIDGALFGLNLAGDAGVGTGVVDLDSDDIRISYTAECTDAGTNAWEVTGFTVTNLTTSQTWSYAGLAQTFTYDDDGATVPATPTDAFFSQQMAPNGQATFTARSSRVVMNYASSAVDSDLDGLSQAEELALGTSDGKADTDGDTFSDFVEVNAAPATDPLDINSYTDAPLRSEEDFDAYALGTPATSLWSTKWDGANTSQRNLWAVGASNGVGSSQGYALDVTKAWLNYHTVNKASITGDVMTLSGDFRFSTTGAPLNEEPASGLNGVNDGFAGLLITTSADWWGVNAANGQFTFRVARRADNNWGVDVNGINAWLSNADIGLAGGLTASTSDWFTLNAQIAPNAGGTAYEIVCTVYYQGTALYTHPAIELDNIVYPIGGDMYGGLTTGYNSDPSNTGDATGDDATLQMPVGSIAKVVSVDVDNFSFVGYPYQLEPHGLTMNPTVQDLDANGLPDIWEAIYQAWGLDPAADADGDGTNNGTEAGFGTDPFDPNDSPSLSIRKGEGDNIILSWAQLEGRPGSAIGFTDFGALPLPVAVGTPVLNGDRWELTIPISQDAEFFQIANSENDLDGDGVPDWIEPLLGFSSDPGDSESAALGKSYDTDGDEVLDTTLSGDLSAFNEIYRRSESGTRLTQAQAARLLLQGTFGPASISEVDFVARIGAKAWLDQQMLLPESYTRPYIDAIKADFENGQADLALAGYQINGGGGTPFVGGGNYTTAWMRVALQSEDQLRQRVAFALSQVLVASRSSAGLANQPRATAAYYDLMIEHAFGNFEDLLLQVSISPYMGNYLSHLGNRKADISIDRYPDENYAREVMQLFSIGLWELNLDGTQKLDAQNEPIPTYGNYEITELARVFTGTHYASSTNSGTSFGAGWRDDGGSEHEWMITPMKVYATEHDFDSKQIVAGDGAYHTIPARSATDENAMQDVKDVVYHLVRHPNAAPFICRQLIQFLITSNPSPEYVARVASEFVDNGSGVPGDMNAVVRAIYLDEEARDPLQHLGTPYFGNLREPLLRYMHLGRMLKLDRHQDLLTWDWGEHQRETLQEPMNAPSVFNYYRPDFRLFGTLADNGLDSPAFGIVNSYSSISFPNWMWRMCYHGFKYSTYDYPEDLSELTALAGDIPVLLDHLSLLYTAGTLSAESRQTITTALASESNLTERARLAAYLVLVSPEGSCLK